MRMPIARQLFSLAAALLIAIGVGGCTAPTSSDVDHTASPAAGAKADLESQDTTSVVSSGTAEAPADTTGAGNGRGGGFIGSGH
jgi:hypothetical protein